MRRSQMTQGAYRSEKKTNKTKQNKTKQKQNKKKQKQKKTCILK